MSKRKRKGRVASTKTGYKSLAQIYGDSFTEEDKFVTFREMTEIWNRETGENVKINTMCVRYHNAMFKLAKALLPQFHPDITDEKIYEISRSVEFAVGIRDMIAKIDSEPGEY